MRLELQLKFRKERGAIWSSRGTTLRALNGDWRAKRYGGYFIVGSGEGP